MTLLTVLEQQLLASGPKLGIIADFDGVLAHNNTQRLLDGSYEVISKYHAFDYGVFSTMFTSLVPYPLEYSVDFLLKSLGLLDVKAELLDVLMNIDDGIDEAKTFINLCLKMNIPLYVLSSGNIKSSKYQYLSEKLGHERVIASPSFSKANPFHYQKIIKELQISAQQTLYIDDSPVALNSAKLAGFHTALMTNQVFTRATVGSIASFVDTIFDDWGEVIKFITEKQQCNL